MKTLRWSLFYAYLISGLLKENILLFIKLEFLFWNVDNHQLVVAFNKYFYCVRKMFCYKYKYIWQTQQPASTEAKMYILYFRNHSLFCESFCVEDSWIMMKVYISLILQSSELNWIKLKTSQSVLLTYLIYISILDYITW